MQNNTLLVLLNDQTAALARLTLHGTAGSDPPLLATVPCSLGKALAGATPSAESSEEGGTGREGRQEDRCADCEGKGREHALPGSTFGFYKGRREGLGQFYGCISIRM